MNRYKHRYCPIYIIEGGEKEWEIGGIRSVLEPFRLFIISHSLRELLSILVFCTTSRNQFVRKAFISYASNLSQIHIKIGFHKHHATCKSTSCKPEEDILRPGKKSDIQVIRVLLFHHELAASQDKTTTDSSCNMLTNYPLCDFVYNEPK